MGRKGASEIKIGCTLSVEKTPQKRAKELSTTAVPTPFEVLHAYQIDLPEQTEQAVHRQLSRYRIAANREFFNCDVDTARAAIKQQIGDVKSQEEIAKAERLRLDAEWKRQREELAIANAEMARQAEERSRKITEDANKDRMLRKRYHELQDVKDQKYIGWGLWALGFAHPGFWLAALVYTVWLWNHNEKEYKPRMTAIDAEANRIRADNERKYREKVETDRILRAKKQREVFEANENRRIPVKQRNWTFVVVALIGFIVVAIYLGKVPSPKAVPAISNKSSMLPAEPLAQVAPTNQAPEWVEHEEGLLLYMKKNREIKHVYFRDKRRYNPYWERSKERSPVTEPAEITNAELLTITSKTQLPEVYITPEVQQPEVYILEETIQPLFQAED